MAFSAFFIFAVLLVSTHSALASSISASISNNYFTTDEVVVVSGSVDAAVAKTMTATIYNFSGAVINVSTVISSSFTPNTFSIPNTINFSYSTGPYIVSLTDDTDTVNLTFRVVQRHVAFEGSTIHKLGDIINVSTLTLIQTGSENFGGGNFTELLNLSKSSPQKARYGNYSIGGKVYHFALVDQTNATAFDRLYIDDDKDFRLFNDSEDSGSWHDTEYQDLRRGSKFSNGTFTYVVGIIESYTGNKVVMWKPAPESVYETTDAVNITVIIRNSTHLQVNETVRIDVLNSTGHNITQPITADANGFGWLNATINLTSVPAGLYTVSFNESEGTMMIPVEAFRLFVSTSDDSDQFTEVYAKGSTARIWVTSKSSSGAINLTFLSTTIYYPNGTSLTVSESDYTQIADGLYYYDLGLGGAPAGSYAVTVTGSDGANTQRSSTGFSIQSVFLNAEAVNIKYVDDASKSFVNAFAPNRNVTIMTFLLNATAGGFFEGTDGFTGLVSPSDCNSTLSLEELVDENGASYSIGYRSMNVSDIMGYLPSQDIAVGSSPPPEMASQCMLVFPNANLKNGVYRARLKIKYGGEDIFTGLTFSIQRLLAIGSTVDFKGDGFSFLSPNTTVRIKLVVKDLLTDEEVPAGNITSGKIIEMHREWPDFRDILGNTSLRSALNESVTNGTISFLSPNEEGFYAAKFRFNAYVGGSIESGIGDAFFMLKKYMIWGQVAGGSDYHWFVKGGQNVTLQVTIIDIDKAQTAFGYGGGTATCTGCTGFIVNVSQVRNDQQFRLVTDYSVQTGVITNSSLPVANVTIIPGPQMQTGWYSIDLAVTDPSTGTAYFGWGWFEIRNFWVEVQKTSSLNSTHSTLDGESFGGGKDGGNSYPPGSPVTFTVIPREPGTGSLLSAGSIAVENIQFFPESSPTPVSGFASAITDKTFTGKCSEFGCEQFSGKEISISNLPPDKQGRFDVNVRVSVGSVSDIGTYSFDVSSYRLQTSYRQNSFPPLFASTENFTINFTATDFNDQPVNITNVTVEELFAEKSGRPIRIKYGSNYTTVCGIGTQKNVCSASIFLNDIGAEGVLSARFRIINNMSVAKFGEAFFKIQDLLVSIPSIERIWVWEQDSASKKVEQNIWRAEWSGCQEEKNSINGSLKFCGNFWYLGQNTDVNITAPNVSSSKEIFGWIPMMDDRGGDTYGPVANKSNMYVYANGSHLWLSSSSPNLTLAVPISVNGTFSDNKGGIWRLDKIGSQDITIFGMTSLYGRGVLINTSFSKSGIYKLGQIEESFLGAFTSNGRSGLDLNGDGYTNGTLYYAISDSQVSGVYDMFFLSKDGNFTGLASPTLSNPINVNDFNRSNREVGYSTQALQRLTILNIDPRSQNILLYSQQVGDWADLGDVKISNNITIPVIVAAPDGTPKSVNVSINAYKKMSTGAVVQNSLLSDQNITGIGELKFNSSYVGAGEFTLSIKGEDVLEEWKWPRVFVRGFLVDGSSGEGAYLVNQFKPLRIFEWNIDSYGQMASIQQDARNTSFIVNGVLAEAHEFPVDGCQIWKNGANVTNDVLGNQNTYGILRIDNAPAFSYYFYNLTETRLYRNTSCFFNTTEAQTVTNGSTTMIAAGSNQFGKAYNLTAYVDRNDYSGGCFNGCWRADFYVAGIDNSTIRPAGSRPESFPYYWIYMQNISAGGLYDVVLANDTYNYHRCNLEGQQDCIRKAWFVERATGTFGNSVGVTMGQNFTSQLYLAGVGPFDGDGVTIGNFSQLPPLEGFKGPGIKDFPLADGTLAYFAVLNESLLIDFDRNTTLNATHYMFAFDSSFDGQQTLTSAVSDDDLEIVQWSFSDVPIDLSSAEKFTGINSSWASENWNSLPTDAWPGYARFGNEYPNRAWEQQPSWGVPFYNKTHMIIQKDGWRMDSGATVSAYINAYNFDKTKIAMANVSVKQMARALPYLGFQVLQPSNYSVDAAYSTTDSNGVAFLRITPNPSTTGKWENGQYQLQLNVQGYAGNETFERWFCVGVCGP